MRGWGVATALLAVVFGSALPVSADHRGGHGAQAPARVAFSAGFPKLVDSEWGWPLGGFGGADAFRSGRRPVIFVHGNNTDAGDWYPVRDDFRAAGWGGSSLFALSYNGLGGPNGEAVGRRNPEAADERIALGYDGSSRITANDVNVPDLYAFIEAVRRYTGRRQFSIVAHSLGVTLARKTLKVHPELRRDLIAFVGIAGGNHGTSFCPPGSEEELMSCDEIAAGTPWLAELNGPGGVDETYPPAQWMTIYDGSGVGDPAFYGPAYAQSPALRGADNRQFPGTYHNDLRIDPAIVRVYREFIERADAGVPLPQVDFGGVPVPTAPRRPTEQAAAAEPIAASGPALTPIVGLAALAALLAVRWLSVSAQPRSVAPWVDSTAEIAAARRSPTSASVSVRSRAQKRSRNAKLRWPSGTPGPR